MRLQTHQKRTEKETTINATNAMIAHGVLPEENAKILLIFGDYIQNENRPKNKELAKDFGCSSRTIARHLNKHIKNNQLAEPKSVILLMDTTYFEQKYGVMDCMSLAQNKVYFTVR